MIKTASILGVNFHILTSAEAVDCAMQRIRNRQKGYVVTPNAEIVERCYRDSAFKNIVNRAALVLVDGVGVLYAAKILGKDLSERITGIGFAERLLGVMANERLRLFLLGAKPGVAERAAQAIAAQYEGIQVVGTHDGYFSDPQHAVDAINACGGVDVVFVCLGVPRQEQFMSEHMEEIDATLLCGLGGTMDVFAGEAKRAPVFFQKHGLEWLYRFAQQPSRIGRILRLPLFLLLVWRERLFGKGKER